MTVIGVGTRKGAWLARRDGRNWDIEGPFLKGWEIGTFGRAASGRHLLTTSSSWYGAAIHRSPDLAEWTQVVDGPSYGDGSDHKLEAIWTIHGVEGRLFAGVAEAGLFTSDDDGETWHPLSGFNGHPTRPGWQPGFGGLVAHRILHDADDPRRMWVAVSAVGVFFTDDGGGSWSLRNQGVGKTAPNDDFEDIGYCVHCLAADPGDADTIWRQDHNGVFRTTDGGTSWERIENGLPARFGFPLVRDEASGALFVVPQESDQYRLPPDGRLVVYRSLDGGDSWHAAAGGLSEEPTFDGVLRNAMDTDGDGGVFLGTTGGDVWCSFEAGDGWERLPARLPRITSVAVIGS